MQINSLTHKDNGILSDALVVLAGIMWGVLGIFVKSLRKMGFDSVQISALRWIFSALITFLAVTACDRKKLIISLRDVWIFAFIGIFSSLAMSTFYFMCMGLTSIAVSDVLMYTSPIWVMVFSALIFKEKITSRKFVCILLSFCGCAFVSGILNSGGRYNFWGIVFGLCSGIAYSLYGILGKIALKKYDKVTLTVYNMIFAAIGAMFITDTNTVFVLIGKDISCLKYIFFLAIFGTVLPFFLYTFALRYTRASRAAVICCIEPVSAAFVSIFIAKEQLDMFQFAGIAVIILSIILLQSDRKYT